MATKPAATAKPKAAKPVTLKQLAYALAEQHQLVRRIDRMDLEDDVGNTRQRGVAVEAPEHVLDRATPRLGRPAGELRAVVRQVDPHAHDRLAHGHRLVAEAIRHGHTPPP